VPTVLLTYYTADQSLLKYRGTFFNVTIVGIAAFVAPGLYNAMASTGAGGAQTPYLIMAGNAILNTLMFFICFFASKSFLRIKN